MSIKEREQNVRMARRRQQKEKLRKKLIIIGASAAVVLLIGAGMGTYYLYGREDTTAQAKQESSVERTKTTEKKADITKTTKATETVEKSSKENSKEAVNQDLQSILLSYSKEIDQKTPALLEEYHAEIQENHDGLAGLSTIANQKANALQAVANEGIQKMQDTYHNAGSLDTVDLSNWISQLSAKYTEQVARISDALLQSRAAFQAEAETQQSVSQEDTQQITETIETTETTETSTMEIPASNEVPVNNTHTQETSQGNQSTTVVYEGEGPNQIAQRTGISVDRLLELNGMTMEDYFFNPGQTLRLN